MLAHETGLPSAVDPVGGSWFVESLTDEIEARAQDYLDRIDAMGGAIAAIERGFVQDEIHEAAYRIQEGVESGERVVVGVNRFVEEEAEAVEVLRIDEAEVTAQVERVRAWRERRDGAASAEALRAVAHAAERTDNLLPPMREALAAGATLGEVSDALRGVFGEYRPTV